MIHFHHVSIIIISDQGTLFRSKFWVTLSRLLCTDHWLFITFHSQTDYQTEWQNQTLKHCLYCYVKYLQNDWVQQLSLAEHVYNSVIHSVTKVFSFFICMNCKSVLFQLYSLQLKKISLTAAEITKEICHLQKQLITQISKAQDQQIKYYDLSHIQQIFTEGDKVWLKEVHLCTDRFNKKLNHHHLESFSIHKMINDQVYCFNLSNTMKIYFIFHVSLLESYHINELLRKVLLGI